MKFDINHSNKGAPKFVNLVKPCACTDWTHTNFVWNTPSCTEHTHTSVTNCQLPYGTQNQGHDHKFHCSDVWLQLLFMFIVWLNSNFVTVLQRCSRIHLGDIIVFFWAPANTFGFFGSINPDLNYINSLQGLKSSPHSWHPFVIVSK